MRVSEMLSTMRTTQRRKLAGSVVRDEIARAGKSHNWAADAMGIAPSTLARIFQGDERITDVTLRAAEGALDLPDHLLTYIKDGDAKQIGEIGNDEMRSGLRRVILHTLAAIEAEGLEDDTEHKAR